MDTPWENELAALLSELSETQGQLLTLLDDKRRMLVAADTAGLASLHEREAAIVARLQQCQQSRGALLEKARDEGLPSQTIRELASSLPGQRQRPLRQQLAESRARWRLLQHQSLANWVLAQRSLVHLAQLLEIIATGGRSRPTYGNGSLSDQHGALLDQAA